MRGRCLWTVALCFDTREVRRGTLIAGLPRDLLPGLSLVHGRFDLVGKDAQMIGEAAK